MERGANILIHEPVRYCVGTSAELGGYARELERIRSRMVEIIAGRTGQPQGTVEDWLAGERYFTAEEALAVGLIDAIIEPPAGGELGGRRRRAGGPAPVSVREEEQLFRLWLTAFGQVHVRDKTKFAGDLRQWLELNVTEKDGEVR